jgi:hypothetical protein
VSAGTGSAVTLRALEGEPLADEALRGMVVATAHAIAERQGIRVIDVETTPDSITVKLGAARIAAIGFAVELRRLTTSWYTSKYGAATLWGEPPTDGNDLDGPSGDEWKDA